MNTPATPATEGLKPAIGRGSAVLLVMGGIVGVGVFVNPASVARTLHSPVLALAAWAVGGGIALLGAFVYAELAARIPKTGGEYVYLRDTYGPLTGFLYGWTTLLVVQAGGMAAVSIAFAKYLQIATGTHVPDQIVVVAVLAGLAAINCLGVGAGNGIQTGLGLLKVAAIGAVIAGGLLLVPQGFALTHPVLDRPMGVGLVKGFGAALIPVIFAFGGWQTAAYVAGEIKDARKNLARALLLGVLAVVALYLLINIACLRALGVEALGRTLTPTADVLQMAVGPVGARLAAAAIALSALGFVSQSMLTSPRVIFAMARDGLFFRKVGDVAEGSRAPAVAIIVQAVWTGVLALTGSYDRLLGYVIAMNVLFFALSASCLFILRRRERLAATPSDGGYRAPWHPWSTGLFILACAVIVGASFWSYPVDSLIGYGIMLLGIPPYLLWRRRNRAEARA